ncbi:MAG TPA: SDR family oxidoreductase [Oculatellaceae cyanobacterium]
MDLQGKSIVIFGGSSGIGLATAIAAHKRGGRVLIVGRSAERLKKSIELMPGANFAVGDATNELDVARILSDSNTVDHVLVTAAEAIFGAVSDKSYSEVKALIDSKLSAAYHAAKYCSPKMGSTGSITFISGLAAWRPFVTAATAAAANAGVEALGRVLALELKPIRVNTIVPGVIDTPLLDSVLGSDKEKRLAEIGSALPVGRVGRPEDIADAVLFLMGNEFVTGSVLHIDGGALLV